MAIAVRKGKPVDPERAGEAALRIADLWRLSADEQMTLLGIASRVPNDASAVR